MESKEELINNLKEREEYLEGEWYQLADIVDKMVGFVAIQDSDSRDGEDLLTAFTAVRKALGAVKRVISRNK